MSWQQRLKDQKKKAEEYAKDLERKNEYLREELVQISTGFYFIIDKEQDTHTRLQLRAAKALKSEANLPNRKIYL